ncbi:hypothetical protein LSH36_971g00054 [Paralvinella palmiformis]|uniref:Dipeptidase n=1 Tax=Paralvinella palmiformis TaxID=53620 RepID=A0AAD9MTD8_9ANNE|nr:hypothetical protein LSH36_971g00054 [Paralvinella palmiformis]
MENMWIILPFMLSFSVLSVHTHAISEEEALARAIRILEQYPLVDGHNDLPLVYRARIENQINLVNLSIDVVPQWGPSHTDIPRLRQGKSGAAFWITYVSCTKAGKDAVRAGLEQIDVIKRYIAQYPNDFQLVTTADGIEEAFFAGKIGSLIGMEGGHMIDSSFAALRLVYDMGIRYLGLTHSCSTPWATTCEEDETPPGATIGLTNFGKMIITEMNRMGMIVDLAHVSRAAMIDALNTTKAPLIFSHSNAWTLCNHERNVQDDVLEMLRENNGLIMVTFVGSFLTCSPSSGQANVTHAADHIEYIRDLIGVDHVGIGSDYDGMSSPPIGLEDTSKFPNLFAELIQRGWSDADLEKLAGRNLVRVFRGVEQVRDSLAATDGNDEWIPQEDLPINECRTTG